MLYINSIVDVLHKLSISVGKYLTFIGIPFFILILTLFFPYGLFIVTLYYKNYMDISENLFNLFWLISVIIYTFFVVLLASLLQGAVTFEAIIFSIITINVYLPCVLFSVILIVTFVIFLYDTYKETFNERKNNRQTKKTR